MYTSSASGYYVAQEPSARRFQKGSSDNSFWNPKSFHESGLMQGVYQRHLQAEYAEIEQELAEYEDEGFTGTSSGVNAQEVLRSHEETHQSVTRYEEEKIKR